jgi:translocation and assembly module TamA
MVRPAVRRRAGLLALAFAAGSAGCARVQGTDAAPAVMRVRFEGVRAFDEEQIVAKLATHASDQPPRIPIAGPIIHQTKLQLGSVDVAVLDPDALAVDRRRIEAFYRERGYYEARVEDVQVLPAGRRRVEVVFRVDEGARIRVAKLTVNGLDTAPEAQRRLGRLPLKVGDAFTEGAYDAARNAIQAALRSTGWATSDVAQHATVLPDRGTAEVVYDVVPGDRWKFGPIFIAGTSAVPRDRIREQVLGALRPGDWFDDGRLAQAQARVFDLGVFGAVRVTRGQPDAARGTIPIVVAVREAPFRTLRFGPGLGFQVIRWDAHALVGWQHRNFYGELRRIGMEARLGYAWLPNPYTPTKQGTVGLVALDFAQPGALTRYIDTSVRLELEKGIEQAYDFYSERLRLGLPLRLAPRWTLVPSYNLEVFQLSNFGVQFDPSAPADGRTLENCVGSICLLTYLEQRIAWDGRDNPVNTRRGLYVAFSLQEGFDVGAYGYRYLRFLPEARVFRPLGPRTVLAARARVGALVPVTEQGNPPLVARFFAGGPLSMRGYYTRRLAPMVRQRNDWVPVGGNGLAEANVELRFDVTGNLGLAVFVDAGSVTQASDVPSTWQSALDPTLVQWASGVGVRYRTPFGPLRLDLGVRLPERFGKGTQNFPAVPFTNWPDGTPHREPIIAIHLSLGEAF